MTAPTAEPFDPLGRLAEHSAHDYDHPTISVTAMTGYWERVYADEARAIGADLADEHARAVDAVAECEAATQRARDAVRERRWDVGQWETEQRWRADQIAFQNLRHRLVRLEGRRDALAAEMKRRGQG